MSRALVFAAVACAALACTRGNSEGPPPQTDPVEQPPAEQLTPTPDPELGIAPAMPSSPLVPAVPPPPLSVTATITREPSDAMKAAELRWVTLRLDLVGADPGELAVELVAPGELPYERRTARLTATAFDAQHVEFTIPVAGTMIERSNLTGAWAANFFLDGQPVASQSFEVIP